MMAYARANPASLVMNGEPFTFYRDTEGALDPTVNRHHQNQEHMRTNPGPMLLVACSRVHSHASCL